MYEYKVVREYAYEGPLCVRDCYEHLYEIYERKGLSGEVSDAGVVI